MLQNISFISLITELILITVKQEIDMVIKNLYFKLLADNITPSIFKKFSLEKIESNIKVDIFFFHSLIRETSDI